MGTILLDVNLRNRLIVSIGFLLILVGVAGYFLVKRSNQDIIEQQALTIAEIVVQHASTVRSVYSDSIVGKLQADGVGGADFHSHEKAGTVPLPAQFIKSIAGKASTDADGLYEYRAVSKWNLAANQSLNNDFLRSAWEELEKQDQPDPIKAISWQSTHKIINKDGVDTLYFMRADPAVSHSCVACHNAYEKSPEIIQRRIQQGVQTGKRWKKHQLLGAFFVQIPLSGIQSIAVKKSTETMIWIVSVLTGGLVLLAWFLVGDVSKAQENTRRLFWQARHDMLTKLPNRNYFEERLNVLIQQAKSTGHIHCMCYLDLDRFKVVNDSCGHASGDELLCEIAAILSRSLRKDDLLARLGGDEFGVLLENSSRLQAEQVAKSLCHHVNNYHFVSGDQFFDIGVSIGLVEINSDTESVEIVLKHSDIACYAAKESGRNRVQFYHENDNDISLRCTEMSWVSKILLALEEKRLKIFAQKISAVSSVTDSGHTHFEILVRLIDSNGSVVPPGKFLPAAERYDLMKKIDIYVIEEVFNAFERKLFSELDGSGFISINLSGHALSDAAFLGRVIGLMEQYNINPRQLCFEITETAAIKNPELVRRFMHVLKAHEVKFALDDFGTGLSSLTYLKQFPVDYLKIDGSFVRDMINNSVDRKLVRAINQLAHTMNIKTIAEYVESREIFSLLAEMDVDYAQGFYINKPQAVVPLPT